MKKDSATNNNEHHRIELKDNLAVYVRTYLLGGGKDEFEFDSLG